MKLDDIAHAFDLSFLLSAVNLVDANLERLESESKLVADPDAFGTYDKMEYLLGFGLLACQTYITACVARTSLSKTTALDVGPRHACGQSMAILLNALANYWKHHSEWERSLSPQAQRTIDVIESLNVEIGGEYIVANSLHLLLQPQALRIQSVLPCLRQWHSALQDVA